MNSLERKFIIGKNCDFIETIIKRRNYEYIEMIIKRKHYELIKKKKSLLERIINLLKEL